MWPDKNFSGATWLAVPGIDIHTGSCFHFHGRCRRLRAASHVSSGSQQPLLIFCLFEFDEGLSDLGKLRT